MDWKRTEKYVGKGLGERMSLALASVETLFHQENQKIEMYIYSVTTQGATGSRV
jgi:hypothetical protein